MVMYAVSASAHAACCLFRHFASTCGATSCSCPHLQSKRSVNASAVIVAPPSTTPLEFWLAASEDEKKDLFTFSKKASFPSLVVHLVRGMWIDLRPSIIQELLQELTQNSLTRSRTASRDQGSASTHDGACGVRGCSISVLPYAKASTRILMPFPSSTQAQRSQLILISKQSFAQRSLRRLTCCSHTFSMPRQASADMIRLIFSSCLLPP